MQSANDLLAGPIDKLPSMQQPTTTTAQPIFSEHDRDVTAYFFLRLKNVYGSKYAQQYPTQDAVDNAKREYAKRIGQLDRQKIHELFESLKAVRELMNSDFDWPDVDKILGLGSQMWEHRRVEAADRERILDREHRLVDKSAQKRSRVAGSKAIGQMKALFGE